MTRRRPDLHRNVTLDPGHQIQGNARLLSPPLVAGGEQCLWPDAGASATMAKMWVRKHLEKGAKDPGVASQRLGLGFTQGHSSNGGGPLAPATQGQCITAAEVLRVTCTLTIPPLWAAVPRSLQSKEL